MAMPAKATPMPVSAEPVAEPVKKGGGRIALMITGIVGAMGIGIGAAQYMNKAGKEPSASGVPTIKSAEKAPVHKKKSLSPEEISPMVSMAEPEPSAPPAPQDMDRDRAYKTGMSFVARGEYEKALPYLEEAEKAGHPEAGYNLASLYAMGKGVEQDYQKARQHLEIAAQRGYYPAMTNLGLLYARGNGVEQDYDKARELWEKAAAGEHPDAMHNLAVIYATGKGVDKDMSKAVKWYRRAANAGYVDSIANLGLLYANGDGVERNYAEAKRLWEIAAAKGHRMAAMNLEKLKRVMARQH